MKDYKKVNFGFGDIEEAVNLLLHYKNEGILAYINFNDNILYSDTVTMDSAYKQITGKTKVEFDEAQRKWREDYDRKEQEHKDKIPELTKLWIARGHGILAEDKWEHWDKIVPIRLGDLYHGMELGNCLDIIQSLNEGNFDEAKQKLNEQGHSDMSYGLVCLMVKEFSEKGEEFVNYIK